LGNKTNFHLLFQKACTPFYFSWVLQKFHHLLKRMATVYAASEIKLQRVLPFYILSIPFNPN
jgi:hypothetical protein